MDVRHTSTHGVALVRI